MSVIEYEAGNAGKEGPKVSVIIPVYNAARYIDEAFFSVAAQTYPNWELILVDDASTDGSREYLKELAERSRRIPSLRGRIKLCLQACNTGPAAARNAGIRAAEGRFLAYLDADDLWKADKLEKQLEFMLRGGYAFSFTGYEFADQKGRRSGRAVRVPERLTYREALGNTTISTITVMLDREQIPEGLLIMPEASPREDTATWWRILRNGYVAYGMNEVLSVYRRHPDSHSANKWKAIRGTWRTYRQNEGMTVWSAGRYFTGYLFRAVKRRTGKIT